MDDGRVKFNRGSFGEILPPSFATLFEEAGRTPPVRQASWQAGSGNVHSFRVCGAGASDSSDLVRPGRGESLRPPKVALEPVLFRPHLVRWPFTAETASDRFAWQPALQGDPVAVRDLAVGTLVHLLMQRNAGRPVAADELLRQAHSCVASARFVRLSAAGDVVDPAVALYARLQSREAVAALADQTCLFEVPFSHVDRRSADHSLEEDTVVRRGTIDCLARAPDGRITVLEFKTGQARPEHERQLDLYVAAVQTMFPTTAVEGQLVYP